MNLQCPNCQKLLTVQEHYAGQLMKCPLCKENFTVPALPAGPPMEPAPAFAAPGPPAPDHYGLKQEPDPAFAALGSPTAPASPPEPAFSTAPAAPPAPPPISSLTTEPDRAPAPAPTLTAGYTHVYSLWFSDRILRWVAPAAVVLIFLLQLPLFSWVGIYPGGVEAASQGAWGAAFGAVTPESDMPKKIFEYKSDKDKPGMSPLVLFYLLLFLPTLVVTVGVAALPYIKAPLPPQVQQILPWKWAIVAALNALLLLFLGMQLLIGFSIENTFADTLPTVNQNDTSVDKNATKVERGQKLEWIQRTFWLKFVVLLHILAVASAALVYWVEKRGPSRPLPRIDISW